MALIPLAEENPEQHLNTLLQVFVEYEKDDDSSKAIRSSLLRLFKRNLQIHVTESE